MHTLTKELQNKITPDSALGMLKDGNTRFVNNLKKNRDLLQQMNETSGGQNPFAVIVSCMDSRTSAELIFDQGIGDIFSIRIAGNIINGDIIGSTEFGTKVVGAKIVVVLGHTGCGAVKGAIDNVELGSLHFVTSKIQRCIPAIKQSHSHMGASDLMPLVGKENVLQGMEDLRKGSQIISDLEKEGKIKIVGGMYDIASGVVEFY